MKYILKIGSTKVFFIRILFTFMISIGIAVSGCARMDDIPQTKEEEYLDMDVYNYTRCFSEDEILVLSRAFLRVEDYILFDKEGIQINISYKEANISERLYNYLLTFNLSTEFGTIRLKSEGPEITYGQNFVRKEAHIGHNEILTLMNGMQTDYSHIGYATAITAWIPQVAIQSFIIGTKAYLEGLSWSRLESQYLDSGSTSGARLIELTVYSPTTGISHTGYQLVFD